MKCLVTGGRRFAERFETYLEKGGKPGTPEAKELDRLDGIDRKTLQNAFEGFLSYAKSKGTKSVTFIHGACPRGADMICANWIAYMNTAYLADAPINKFGFSAIIEDAHPANWVDNGKSAGPIRNTEMVQCGPDYCIAAWDGTVENSGTFDCLLKAVKSHITVRIVPY